MRSQQYATINKEFASTFFQDIIFYFFGPSSLLWVGLFFLALFLALVLALSVFAVVVNKDDVLDVDLVLARLSSLLSEETICSKQEDNE